jgi:DNA mismatch endonuclease (patch repair protein)
MRVTPDLVFRSAKVAVFVDGCYWHGCPAHFKLPRANRDYWRNKIERTIARDEASEAALLRHGWQVVRVWEHEPVAQSVDRIRRAIRQ